MVRADQLQHATRINQILIFISTLSLKRAGGKSKMSIAIKERGSGARKGRGQNQRLPNHCHSHSTSVNTTDSTMHVTIGKYTRTWSDS
jgi:hypothetical protein